MCQWGANRNQWAGYRMGRSHTPHPYSPQTGRGAKSPPPPCKFQPNGCRLCAVLCSAHGSRHDRAYSHLAKRCKIAHFRTHCRTNQLIPMTSGRRWGTSIDVSDVMVANEFYRPRYATTTTTVTGLSMIHEVFLGDNHYEPLSSARKDHA